MMMVKCFRIYSNSFNQKLLCELAKIYNIFYIHMNLLYFRHHVGILLVSLGSFIPHQCIVISTTHCSSTIVLYVYVFDEINK